MSATLAACGDGNFGSDCRSIAGSGYSLCRDANGSTVYYIEPAGEYPSDGGVVHGTVKMIGWSDSVIVASRISTFRGDPDGYMVIDLATKKVEGPFTDGEILQKLPNIELQDASKVWLSL
jgi:hypothetical protein